ncbi:MAG TPA: CvpA family protein, partial [Terriglobales bacterium]
ADVAIVAVVLLSALLAAAQGFFFEIFSLAGTVIGYLLAAWGYTRVAPLIEPYVKTTLVANIAAFLVIFLAVTLLASAIGRLVRASMKDVGLRWFDRLLGALFGLARGLLVVMVIALALASFTPESPVLSNSRLAPYLLVAARAAVWLAPTQVRMQFRAGMDALSGLRKDGKPSAADKKDSAAPAARPAPR